MRRCSRTCRAALAWTAAAHGAVGSPAARRSRNAWLEICWRRGASAHTPVAGGLDVSVCGWSGGHRTVAAGYAAKGRWRLLTRAKWNCYETRANCREAGIARMPRRRAAAILENSALAGGGVLLGAGAESGVAGIWSRPLPLEPNYQLLGAQPAAAESRRCGRSRRRCRVLAGPDRELAAAYFIRRASPRKSVAVFEALGCGSRRVG